MRLALGVEYDGRDFSGWERQPGAATVQATVEVALSRVANHPVKTVCAGRTDAGVHALGQILHFDTTARRSLRSWVFGANANLPYSVSVAWARFVPDDFHARFSARSRHYRYIIFNRPIRPALFAGRVTWECRPLNAHNMACAAGYLVGEHDFSAYRALSCQARNPVRRVHQLNVSRHEESLVTIDIVANAFLQHMVRNIAGVLMAVGTGKQAPEWAREVLEARDRTRGGITARPDGLYLMNVAYPARFSLPSVSSPFFLDTSF